MESISNQKLEPPSSEVTLTEVQKDLKALRQKRLIRLSAFVTAQSKISEIRSLNRERDSDDNESVNRSSGENVVTSSFEAISEDESSVSRKEIFNKIKNKKKLVELNIKQLPKRKFLNKLNCVINQEELYSSTENLTTESQHGENSKMTVGRINKTEIAVGNLNREMNQNSIQSLSQSDHTSYFLKEDPLDSVLKESTDEQVYFSLPSEVNGSKQEMKTFGSTQDDSPGKSSSGVKKVEPNSTIPLIKDAESRNFSVFQESTTAGINKTDEFKLKYFKNPLIKSTKENHKKTLNLTNEEKIMKKLQINYLTLDKLLKNGSDEDYDVDTDEIEDFKKTLCDAKTLLVDYEIKMTKLQQKLPVWKVNNTRRGLEDIRRHIDSFRGRRKDISYIKLAENILFYEKEILHISNRFRAKQELLEYAKLCSILLEDKVRYNEVLLYEVFTELVDVISSSMLMK